MAFVGEALVSALIGTLFEKVASADLLQFARQEEVVADIMEWEKTLRNLRAVLVDAEEQQLTSERVKIWLDDLTYLVYDVEDILDEFATEAFIKAETTMTTTKPIGSKVGTFFIRCAGLNFRPSAIKFNMKMRSKLDGITSRFQQISARMNDLHLVDTILYGAGTGRTATATTRPLIPTETTCLLDESRVCGRESDKAAVLDLLLSNHHDPCDGEPSDANDAVRVIAITGMGGLGKTTLAQLVYNHDKVQTHFNPTVWVCVSDNFDVARLTKTILQSIPGAGSDVNDLNQLQLNLRNQLSGKTFLVVLDDVWNENPRAWEQFYVPMKSGAQGSRVIVTTRNQGVASTVGATASRTYPLKELSNHEFLSLLAQQALSARDFDKYPDLRDIAQQIAKKCKGLPLAAKTLGAILQGNQNPDAWEEILKSKIWNLPDQEKNDILPALKLSYHHLPSHLKRCFAYCALFPKDYAFKADELVLLWMGEGFLDESKGQRQMEEMGTEFFRELLARSFFQQSDPKSSNFVMHDLIHDLALFVARDSYFNLENNVRHTISGRARHSSFICQRYEIVGKFKAFDTEVKTNLRTLIALPETLWERSNISQKVLDNLLTGMRHLRVLSFTGYNIREIPNVIGNLKHLRYLNFSRCSIRRLPDSVGDLHNLQTLILRNCEQLCALPKGIGKLTNLRHLDVTGTTELSLIPFQVANLTNLRTLSRFVNSPSTLGIGELKNLSDLRGVLAISELQDIANVVDASDANLRNKPKLEELVMEWRDANWEARKSSADHELQVLESLRPHKNLKSLEVAYYGGCKFPRWIGHSSAFTKLGSLTLRGCKNCTSLPSLGALPSLEVLKIEGMGKVASIGDEFYGECESPFASLKKLRFEDMPEWESWSYSSSTASSSFMSKRSSNKSGAIVLFPELERLKIIGCPKLKGGLPKCMGSPELGVGRVEGGGVLFILFSNLKFLGLKKCDNLEELLLPNGRLQSLEELTIRGCPKLESLFPETGLPPTLRRLEVGDCESFKELPLHNSSSSSRGALEILKIEKCPSLRCFHPPPTTNGGGGGGGGGGGIPSTLKELEISDCENLESLPELVITLKGKNNSSTTSTSSLESLEINDCKSLKSFPRHQLPSTLKRLVIWNCSNLEAISSEKVFASSNTSSSVLEYVALMKYPNLRTLTLHPERIKELFIRCCEGLEYCGFLPAGSLSTATHWPCVITQLTIKQCPQLKSLPQQLKDLNSLTFLDISDCPALESFPQGGFPPNLTELRVGRCENLKTPLSEWGLQSLSCLSELAIYCMFPDMVSFPNGDCLIPSSLTCLLISGMPALISISLPTDLHSLTSLYISDMPSLPSLPLPILHSLTFLHLCDMPSLTSLPLPKLDSVTSLHISAIPSLTSLLLPLTEFPSLACLEIERMESLASLPLQNLTSLHTLDISHCPKLHSLGSLLPATLGRIDIDDCPIIKDTFLKSKGEYFSNISRILIDRKVE